MALPFGPYQGQDLTSYEEGNKFLPRQFYSLNTTPSTELASTVGNTGGVTNTSAAYPYIWPPQGGGGGFSGNKFGLNMDTLKTISQPRYVEQGGPANMYGGNYVKDTRKIAQTEGGIWKDIDTNQNVYHANLNVKTPMTMIIDKLTGKKTTGDPYAGTWYGSDWSDEDEKKGLYSRATGPKNIIQRWKAKREFKAEQEKAAADKIAASQAAAEASGANVGHYTPGASHMTRGRDQGGLGLTQSQAQDVSAANEAAGYGGWGLAQGGRIGYNRGRVVNPGGYNGVIDRNIANLKAALEYSDLTPKERAQIEADLQMSIEAKGGWEDQLLSGDPVSQAEGGLIGYFDGGIARLL